MRRSGKVGLVPMWVALCLAAPIAAAQTLDEAAIKQLIQAEVTRQLTTEGVMDEAIEAYIARQKQRRQREQTGSLRVVDPRRDHILGNPNAPLTLIEYSDFECPFCKRFHATVARVMAANDDKFRWVYRHFPLDFHNPGAHTQAQAAECVAKLGGNDAFWHFTDQIYRRTASGGTGFADSKLRPLAEQVGVNGADFQSCLSSGQMIARVEQDITNGKQVGITGTPAGFLINQAGQIQQFSGAISRKELQTMLDQHGK